MLEFLRDVGKHFTIPYMLAKDSVQRRLESGLSYTEFSYMLLQAADYLHLYRTLGVELQTGGADQWGNITAGLELIRRVEGAGEGEELAHALSYPLLLAPNGKPFGKTAEGTSVWLDPGRTSPYAFYQFWLDADDDAVGRLIRLFTLFDRPAIEALEAEAAAAPERRLVQRALAGDITARVHGPDVAAPGDRDQRGRLQPTAARARRAGPRVRLRPAAERDRPARRRGSGTGGPDGGGRPVRAPTVRPAGRSARGGVSINEQRLPGPDAGVPEPIAGRYLVLRSGKKTYRIVRIDPG